MENLILNKLNSDGALYRFQGIIQALDEKVCNPSIAKRMQELESDTVLIAGREVGKYATAVLHILGEKKYSGTDAVITELIEGLTKK